MMLLKYIALCLFFLSQTQAFALDYEIKSLKILEVNSSINPATLNYLENSLKKLSKKNADAVVIKLDTPGGLVTTTKDIITLIGSVDFPVIVWMRCQVHPHISIFFVRRVISFEFNFYH